MRSKFSDKQNADKGSLNIIWLTILFSSSIAVTISFFYRFPISDAYFLSYIGLLLIIAGIILRLIIISTLGQFFTVDITIRQNHKLKTDGFYKYVRHPSYSASLLSFIGFGISLNNWFSLTIVTISIVAAFLFRIKVEEEVLIKQFDSEYLNYKSLTKKIIPFLF
jgi:protein-S-isoprenylcysteine O-methyltransferase Ste14